jgi:hypothetical protein
VISGISKTSKTQIVINLGHKDLSCLEKTITIVFIHYKCQLIFFSDYQPPNNPSKPLKPKSLSSHHNPYLYQICRICHLNHDHSHHHSHMPLRDHTLSIIKKPRNPNPLIILTSLFCCILLFFFL